MKSNLPNFDIQPYLKLMVENSASDLFITEGSTIQIKIKGKNTEVGKTIINSDLAKSAAYSVMNDTQKKTFSETLECDFAIELKNSNSRFRVHIFQQRGHIAMVLRLIPSVIPTLESLNMPDILHKIILNNRGLVLMIGSTGSGKSTTLAAMINHRNLNMSGHILTIEDPVEFSHPNIKSIINQREVGIDTLSYRNALKASLREAPDVILIGEIRDRDTMEAALELSNTGHLAISTLHANNANQALERIINLFPNDMHKQLLMDLSLNMRAIVSQRLVKTVDNKRCAAVEVLINTPYIRELILKGRLDEIKEAMRTSNQEGMITFDNALFDLFKQGRIELQEALNNADSKADLEVRINFG